MDPYFRTEDALFASFAALHLWHSGKYPQRRMAERLKNYALFNLEELLFHSGFGLTIGDNLLWMPYAGAYISRSERGWKVENLDRKITPSQMAFQLLALNEALAEIADPSAREGMRKVIEKQLNWLADQGKIPSHWTITEGGSILPSKERASRTQRAVLYYSLSRLAGQGYGKAKTMLPALRKGLKIGKFKAKDLEGEIFLALTLLEEGNYPMAKEKILRIKEALEKGKAKMNSVEDLALAYFVASHLSEPVAGEFLRSILKNYLKPIGLVALQTSNFQYELRLRDLAALTMASETEGSGVLFKAVYKGMDEAGLFFRKDHAWRLKYPAITLYNYLRFPRKSPIIAVMGRTQDLPNVFLSQSEVSLPRGLKSLKMIFPPEFLDVASDSLETSTSRVSLYALYLANMGRKLVERRDVYSETGRQLIYLARSYIRTLEKIAPGLEEGERLIVPGESLSIKGRIESPWRLEPLEEDYSYSTDTLASYLLARKALGMGVEEKLYALLIEKFREIGYIPEKVVILKRGEGQYEILPSPEKAGKMTVAKFYLVFGEDFLLDLLPKSQGGISPEDLLLLSASPKLLPYFEGELRALLGSRKMDLKWAAARAIAARLLGEESEGYAEEAQKFYRRDLGIPIEEHETRPQGIIYRTDLGGIALYLEAMSAYQGITFDFLDHFLQSGWEVLYREGQNSRILSLPPRNIVIIKGAKKLVAEPGDLLTFRVTTRNICPVAYSRAKDLPQLLIEAKFQPGLVYLSSQAKPQLSLLEPFLWKYQYLNQGEILDYSYQALIPGKLQASSIKGSLRAIGYTGYTPFFP